MEENKNNGYLRKEYGCAVKRYCQTMELRPDDALIAKYREAHDKEHFWDEIKEGIRQVGILEMEIYILANRLVMIVETPQDFDWDSAMKRLGHPAPTSGVGGIRVAVPAVLCRSHL